MWPRNMHSRTSESFSRSLPRDVDVIFCTEQYTVPAFLNPTLPYNFTHGDLHLKNIIEEGSRVTRMVDWATGFLSCILEVLPDV